MRNDQGRASWNIVLNRMFPLAIIALAVVAYANSFRGVFLYDDTDMLRRLCSGVSSGDSLRKIMHGSSRPVVDLTFFLNYLAGNVRPADYHAVNILIHVLTALLLFGIVKMTLRLPVFANRFEQAAPGIAFVSAALWACHPLVTAAVTYIVQRYECMMGFFLLLTLYCTIRGATAIRGAAGWHMAAVIACVAGMGCKEVMIVAPVAVLLYDWIFLSKGSVKVLLGRWGLYLGLIFGWLFLTALLAYSKPTGDNPSVYTLAYVWKGVSPISYLATEMNVILRYLRLAVCPTGLCFDYWWPPAQLGLRLVLSSTIIGGLAIVTALAVFRKRAWGYPLAWFFLILAPTSSFIPRPDPIVEYRMYLPLMGIVVLLVSISYVALQNIAARLNLSGKIRGIVAGGVSSGLLALLVALTIARNEVYRSEESIWKSSIAGSPDNLKAYVGLGAVLLSTGKNDEARECFEETLARCPAVTEPTQYYFKAVKAMTHNNLGVLMFRKGKYQEAEKHFRESLGVIPDAKDVQDNLARALKMQGKSE